MTYEQCLKDFPMLESRFYFGTIQVGKRISEYGFVVWYEFGKENPIAEADIPKAEVVKSEEEKEIDDYRSWLHLEGINDFLKPEPLEEINFVHSNGIHVKWELKSDGTMHSVIKKRNNTVLYWSQWRSVYKEYYKKFVQVYKNSSGTEVYKIFNKEKNSYYYRWISNKPNIEYAKRRNYLD